MVRATRGARHGLAILVAGLAACGSSDAPSEPGRPGALTGTVSGQRFTVLALEGMTRRSAPDLEELYLEPMIDWPVHVAIDWSTPQDARNRLFVMRGGSATMRFEQLGRNGARVEQSVRAIDLDPRAMYDVPVAGADLGYVAAAPDPMDPDVTRIIAYLPVSRSGGFDCKARLAPRDEHDARQTVEAVAAMCRSIRAVDDPEPAPTAPPARDLADRRPPELPAEVPDIKIPNPTGCACYPEPQACNLARDRIRELRDCGTARWSEPADDLERRVEKLHRRAADDREQFARAALACWELAQQLGDMAAERGCVLTPVEITPRPAPSRPRRPPRPPPKPAPRPEAPA